MQGGEAAEINHTDGHQMLQVAGVPYRLSPIDWGPRALGEGGGGGGRGDYTSAGGKSVC